MLVYNVPGRTGQDLDVETILRLAEIPRVVGLKEASSNFGKIARLMAELPREFAVFSGDDATALALIALGARGVISVVSNEIPKEMAKLVAAALENDRGTALALQTQVRAAHGDELLGVEPRTRQVRSGADEEVRRDAAPAARAGAGGDAEEDREDCSATYKLLPKKGERGR